MLYEIMRSINNYFIEEEHYEKWEIVDGSLNLPFLKENQYFIIEGSTFNDGVHTSSDSLDDEEFEGYIYSLAIPKDFLSLAKEIEDYQSNYSEKLTTPYQSESFDGYSYSKSTDSTGKAPSWKTAFNSRLNTWRKI